MIGIKDCEFESKDPKQILAILGRLPRPLEGQLDEETTFRVANLARHPDDQVKIEAMWIAGLQRSSPDVFDESAKLVMTRDDEVGGVAAAAIHSIGEQHSSYRTRAILVLCNAAAATTLALKHRINALIHAAHLAGRIDWQEWGRLAAEQPKELNLRLLHELQEIREMETF